LHCIIILNPGLPAPDPKTVRPVKTAGIVSIVPKTEVIAGYVNNKGQSISDHNKKSMSYKTGKSKSLEDITIKDFLKYPIWIWALDEEEEEGQDETWQKPVTDTSNVTEEIYAPSIGLKVRDTNFYGSAEYDNETGQLSAISLWGEDGWMMPGDLKDMQFPLHLIAMPAINGVKDVEFIWKDVNSDIAVRG